MHSGDKRFFCNGPPSTVILTAVLVHVPPPLELPRRRRHHLHGAAVRHGGAVRHLGPLPVSSVVGVIDGVVIGVVRQGTRRHGGVAQGWHEAGEQGTQEDQVRGVVGSSHALHQEGQEGGRELPVVSIKTQPNELRSLCLRTRASTDAR